MTVQALSRLLISALGLPVSCHVDQRVPKKMVIENGAPTSADKRLINDHIEAIQWLAALKPNTVGVAEYHDDEREYLEVAVLCITARHASAGASPKTVNTTRLAELVHRAVPYPVLLLIIAPQGLFLSLAHKRWAQNEAGKVVLDGEPTTVGISANDTPGLSAEHPFVQALALTRQPQASLLVLYQGWMDCLTAWQAARITGRFTITDTPAQAAARREALRRYQELELESTRLRARAVKEKQMVRQVELNLALKRVTTELEQTRKNL